MKKLVDTIQKKRTNIFLVFLWGLAWLLPWGSLTVEGNMIVLFLFDMFKLGLAILFFLLPGLLLYLLIYGERDVRMAGLLSIAITFSVLIVGLIGLAGRIFGFSFQSVKMIFVLIGGIEILILAFRKLQVRLSKKFWNELRDLLTNPPLVLALLIAVLLMFHDQLFHVDDYTYLAYLTNWQNANILGFKNIVHDLDVIENARYWLAMLPMSEAVLADLSGLSGLLLLGSYLEIYLVIFAIITLYWVARFLGLSCREAGFAALVQIALYSWMVTDYVPTGYWFYLNLSQDKVFASFLIFPTLLFFSLNYIKDADLKNLSLVALAGISMVLTHPVIFVFSVFVILLIGVVVLFLKEVRLHNFGVLSGSFALMMLPHFFIRLFMRRVGQLAIDAASVRDSFESESIVHVVSDVFYGLAPESLLLMDIDVANNVGRIAVIFFRFLPVSIPLLAFLIAIKKINQKPVYWYIFSSVFLTLFATLPYTGWILGYFVSGRMLSRVAWLLPLGICFALVLRELVGQKFFKHSMPLISTVLLGVIFVFVSPVLVLGFSQRFSAYFDAVTYYKQLTQVGHYIDNHTEEPVVAVALDYKDTQFLPGVSANTRLISFRERKVYNGHNDSLSLVEAQKRIDDSRKIQSIGENMLAQDYCNLLSTYNIKYIVTKTLPKIRFENKISSCLPSYQVLFKAKRFLVLGHE